MLQIRHARRAKACGRGRPATRRMAGALQASAAALGASAGALRALTIILLAAAASEIGAQPLPFTSTSEEFVVANAEFVLLHELAHLVIDEKRVPVLGPEESAADYIAAMMLIRPKTNPPNGPDVLLDVAVNTADGFAIAWQQRSELGAGIAYWDSHSLTVQRFSTLACLLYGSDPERFAALPQRVGMPDARATACIMEYAKAAYAVDWLFATYARKEGDPPGEPIEIRFDPPPTQMSRRVLDAILQNGFIDRAFESFNEFVALEKPATFVMRSCRQPQAMWLPESRELVFCYELLDAYAVMSFARSADGAGRPLLTTPRE